MNREFRRLGVGLLVCCVSVATQADVRLPKVYSDHAVLQRGVPLVVWGWANPGEKVTVELPRRSKSVAADKDGKWQVTLEALKNGGPFDMVVKGKNTITVKDLLVGDVWLCAGQSNMEWPLSNADNAGDVIPAATNSNIRLLHVKAGQFGKPADDIPNTWTVCSPQTASGFSAVGYFFGQKLQAETGVPMGLIGTAWGGTPIELWLSPEEWKQVAELVKINPEANGIGGIFHGRIAPLAPYGIKGAIWYQGEANGGDDDIYYHKTRALITCWRQTWGQLSARKAAKGGKAEYALPFYFVQLADSPGANDDPAGGDGWAKIRMAQFKSLRIPKTGMALAIDIGAAGDIQHPHPLNKEDVGHRLAFWALAKDYGRSKLVCSGPLYKSMKVEGSKLRLAFDYVGTGLMIGRKEGHGPAVEATADAAKPGAKPVLRRFAVAGANKQWFWADAVIDGSTVVVASTNVPNPVAVRYAFSMNPAGGNLYNMAGLPASPFRTDDW